MIRTGWTLGGVARALGPALILAVAAAPVRAEPASPVPVRAEPAPSAAVQIQEPIRVFNDLPPSFRPGYFDGFPDPDDYEDDEAYRQARVRFNQTHQVDEWYVMTMDLTAARAISMSTVSRSGDTVDFWHLGMDRIFFNSERLTSPRFGLFRYRINCRDRTIQILKDADIYDADHPIRRNDTVRDVRPLSTDAARSWHALLCVPGGVDMTRRVLLTHRDFERRYKTWIASQF